MSDFKPIGGTVRSRAAHELRDRVLTGRLRPGDRLDLDEVAEEFGTSRTPVREALLELSYEGLVAVTPRSGITVVGISPEDAVDNFAVLAALAGKAAEWATAEDHRVAARRTPPSRRRRGRGTGRGRRQPSLPSRRQPRRRVAPAAHLPPPGGAGRPGELLRPLPGAGTAQPHRARRPDRRHRTRRRARAPCTIAEAHVLDAGAALGDWMRANAGANDRAHAHAGSTVSRASPG